MAIDLADLVRRYNAACSTAGVDEVMAFFTDDAVIYDLNHPPVVGRRQIGWFWDRIREKWGGAVWETDSVVADGSVAAAEWTMRGVADGEPFTFRGVDVFHADPDGRFTEIRQYWRFDPTAMTSGLVGFPYPDA